MPDNMINVLKKAAALNKQDPLRDANILNLPENGRLIIAGDIHGHRANFKKIVKIANLANNPDTHVILQEIIHGGPVDSEGGCLSFELVCQAAQYKIDFPDQVHFVMGNHDSSVILESDVLKNGKEMNRALFAAMKRVFGDRFDFANLALKQFFFSQPLAARTKNGIFISHSLPGDLYLDQFDPVFLYRDLQINDIVRPNSCYQLLWGRRHSQQALDRLAEILDAELFILGHQRQEDGFLKAGNNLLIIASDHNFGTVVELDLSRKYDIDSLVSTIIKLENVY